MAAIRGPDGSIPESHHKPSSTTDLVAHVAREALAHPVVATGALTDHAIVSNPSGEAASAKTGTLGIRVLGLEKTKEAEIEHLLSIVLPKPTGPHAIGHKDLLLEDPSREDLFVAGTNRHIKAELYVPAIRVRGSPVSFHLSPDDETANVFKDVNIKTSAFDEYDKSPEQHPCVLFVPGGGHSSDQYRPLLEELASRGIVCLGINSCPLDKFDMSLLDALPHLIESDLHFIIDQIREGRIAGIDKESPITCVGHSVGGAASIQASINDDRIGACVNLDGALRGSVLEGKLRKPFTFVITGQRYLESDPRPKDEGRKIDADIEAFISRSGMEEANTRVVFDALDHSDFGIYPYLDLVAGQRKDDISAVKEAQLQVAGIIEARAKAAIF